MFCQQISASVPNASELYDLNIRSDIAGLSRSTVTCDIDFLESKFYVLLLCIYIYLALKCIWGAILDS